MTEKQKEWLDELKKDGLIEFVEKEFPSLIDFEKHPEPSDEVDNYINDNYHVYTDSTKRDILVKMVMEQFNVSFNCASYWITMTTT